VGFIGGGVFDVWGGGWGGDVGGGVGVGGGVWGWGEIGSVRVWRGGVGGDVTLSSVVEEDFGEVFLGGGWFITLKCWGLKDRRIRESFKPWTWLGIKERRQKGGQAKKEDEIFWE